MIRIWEKFPKLFQGEAAMWNRVGHKSGKRFRCDLCGCCRSSLGDLLPHLRRSHSIARVEPVFAFGLLYAETESAPPGG